MPSTRGDCLPMRHLAAALLLAFTPTTAWRARLVRAPPPRMCGGMLPMEPSPELSPAQVVYMVCLGLEQGGRSDEGLERLFNFITPACRVSIAPPVAIKGRQGGVELDHFLAEAEHPAIAALTTCDKFELIDEPTISPGSIARGRLAQQMVHVWVDPLRDGGHANPERALKALLDGPDDHLIALMQAKKKGTPPPPTPLKMLRREQFVISLDEQRRPPQQGCWLIKELFPMAKTALQELNSGGEEFEGEDTV